MEKTNETASLGCAIVAYKYLNVYKDYDEAVKNMVHKSVVFKPNQDNHEKYDVLFNKVYKKMFNKLSGIYLDIKEFNKKYTK